MMFRWQANDGPTLNAGFGFSGDPDDQYIRNPIFFVIFKEGGVPDPMSPPPPLDPRMLTYPEEEGQEKVELQP